MNLNKQLLTPSIVIVSSSNTKPKSLIKLISGATNIVENSQLDQILYSWKIDTKYYTADVDIYGITENYVRTSEFNNAVEALIIHMDTNKETGLEDLTKWCTLQSECDPEIKLLISNYCTNDTKITKVKATEWCLKRGFELIELYPNISKCSTSDEDELIKEKFGVERIIEALQAHIWPNLIMKEKCATLTSGIKSDNVTNEDFPNTSTFSTNESIDGSALNDFLTEEGIDDFSDLFSQLHMIKDSIKSMPTSQRKQCAEQMVTAFWRAIGGDEEEIADTV